MYKYQIPFFPLLLFTLTTAHAADTTPELIHHFIELSGTDKAYITAFPASGSLKDIAEAYTVELRRQGIVLPDDYEIIIMLNAKLNPDYKYTHQEIMNAAKIIALIEKKQGSNPPASDVSTEKQVPSISTPKERPSAALTSLSSQTTTLAWYTAPSKSKYFLEKYKQLVLSIKPDYAKYYALFLANQPTYSNLLKIINTMGEIKIGDRKPSVVINEMLMNAGEEPYHTILSALADGTIVRSIAALQKTNGNGSSSIYKEIPHYPNPLLKKIVMAGGAVIDMTIYRFVFNIIQEIDTIDKKTPIKKGSALYNFLNKLDQALSTIE